MPGERCQWDLDGRVGDKRARLYKTHVVCRARFRVIALTADTYLSCHVSGFLKLASHNRILSSEL